MILVQETYQMNNKNTEDLIEMSALVLMEKKRPNRRSSRLPALLSVSVNVHGTSRNIHHYITNLISVQNNEIQARGIACHYRASKEALQVSDNIKTYVTDGLMT